MNMDKKMYGGWRRGGNLAADSGVLRFTALAVNHNRKIFGERHSGYLPVFCLLRLF